MIDRSEEKQEYGTALQAGRVERNVSTMVKDHSRRKTQR
jgi:hypothetical protein